MSQGAALRWSDAQAVAGELVGLLADACERIEIAGSIRRRKGEVHDIELVAIPRIRQAPVADLWGETLEAIDELDDRIARMIAEGGLEPRVVESNRADGSVGYGFRMGKAYRALTFAGMPVDLFATDADRWGCIFALRTGPGDWNTRLVTDCKRWFRRVEDGRVLYHEKPIPTPDEASFFRALGVPWLDPWDRRVERLSFDRDLLRQGVPA